MASITLVQKQYFVWTALSQKYPLPRGPLDFPLLNKGGWIITEKKRRPNSSFPECM
jgi:hypothetical protein